MNTNLSELIPKTKFETEKIEALILLGYPAVEPIIRDLMEWIQDMNWPVARVLQPFLASIGAPLEPYIREVLKTDDEIWKYWVILDIIGESPQLFEIFLPELERIANNPTPREHAEELDEIAQSVLEKKFE